MNTIIYAHKDSTKIKEICTEREVKKLVHFTRIGNLLSILHKGLLSRKLLESQYNSICSEYNDFYRHDGCKEAICLSISFPNYKMFYKYSMANRRNWVVLLLEASILWELDCAFCHENAASTNVRQIPLELRKQSNALEAMFCNYKNVDREKLEIPPNYPTHPQAEVLVLQSIKPEYICGVHFYDKESATSWLYEHTDSVNRFSCYKENFFFYGTVLFSYRKDAQAWS